MTLINFKNQLKHQLIKNDPDKVIPILRKRVITDTAKNHLIQLERDYRVTSSSFLKGTIDFSTHKRETNSIVDRLLLFIDKLGKEDLTYTDFTIKDAHSYSKEWDDNRVWFIKMKSKLHHYVKADITFEEDGKTADIISRELYQIMNWIEKYLKDQPIGGYSNWIKEQLSNCRFSSHKLTTLLNAIDALSNKIATESTKTGKPPKNIVVRFKVINEKTKAAIRARH